MDDSIAYATIASVVILFRKESGDTDRMMGILPCYKPVGHGGDGG
jgi:hypothetical protein